MNEIEQAQHVMYKIMKSYSVNEIGSKICSIVYLAPEPVCLEELSQQTGYSLASVSNTVKTLAGFFLINRVKKPGTKKVFVTGRISPLDMMKQKTSHVLQMEVKPIKESFPQLIKSLEGKKKYQKELSLMKKQYQETLQLEKIIIEIKKIIENVQ